MRAVSPSWRTILAYTHPLVSRVDSYLGGEVLANNIPITKGKITYDDTGTLKRRLTIEVPARTPGQVWDPAGRPTSPLAAYGQRLRVTTGIGYPNGAVELLDHGWFLVTSWKRQESQGAIAVEATDLALLLQDDRLETVQTPPAGATFASEFRRLIGSILPAVVDASLVDRALPSSVTWDRDRDKALNDLCDAWPARWYVDDTGSAHASPPYALVDDTTPPDLVLTDGALGTVVSRARQGERGAIYNVVVIDGKTGDNGAAAPHAKSEITSASSPIRVSGPYGRVTRFYSSDLITTPAQAKATADSLLVTYSTAGRAEQATIVPDPSIQLGDVARIYTRDGNAFTGRVNGLGVPLTPDDAPMDIRIAMLPAGVVDLDAMAGGT